MVDARLPERYLTDRQIVRLSDSARSGHFMALMWSVSNRTDGRIERADLSLIPTLQPSVIPALVAAELWLEDGADAWVIADYERTQTTRAEFEVLDNARRADREKKRRLSAAAKEGGPPTSPGQSPGHVPGTAQARQGQARLGKEERNNAGTRGAGASFDSGAEVMADLSTGVVLEDDEPPRFERVVDPVSGHPRMQRVVAS